MGLAFDGGMHVGGSAYPAAPTAAALLDVGYGRGVTDRPASSPAPLPRRRVLRGLVGGGVAAAATGGLTGLNGCSAVDPIVRGGAATPPAAPTPAPTPVLAGSLDAAALETALAGQASSLGGRSGLPAGQRARLELVAADHRRHAIALAAPQPTRRPTVLPTPTGSSTGSPSDSPSATRLPRLSRDVDDAVDDLQAQLLAAAKTYARTTVHTTGSTALLWGSLTVSARMAADAVARTSTVTAEKLTAPADLPLVTDTAAAQQLVAQLHAIIWGYRAALAAMSGAPRDRATADLRTRMVNRDRLTGWLQRRKQQVPAAEPAYLPPVAPTTSARAARLILVMETALLPFAGQWLAACDESSRAAALSGLSSTGRTTVYWGGPPRTWPGWPA